MTRKELKQLIKEVALQEEKSFYRLPKKIIGNQLYSLNDNMNSFYKSVSAGNDVHIEDIDEMIGQLQKIKSACKKFTSNDSVTDEYKFKK